MYIIMPMPIHHHGHSGPWKQNDTNIVIATLIVFSLVCLISIIIEWKFTKNYSFKEYIKGVLSCGYGSYSGYLPSLFTTIFIMIYYIILAMSVIGFSIYGLTTIM